MSTEPDPMTALDRDAPLLKIAGRLARFGGWSIDLRSGELYWSEELYRMLGLPVTHQPPYEVAIGMYPEGRREEMQAAVDRCAADGTPMDLESVILDAGGRELAVRVIGEAVRDESGAIIGLRGAFHDVTAIVSAREDQLATDARWRSTLDKVLDPVVLFDREWRVTFANATAVAFAGMPVEELMTRSIWELFPEISTNSFRAAYEGAMLHGRVSSTREYIAQIDRWIEMTVHPTESGIAAVYRDVSADEAAKRVLTDQAARLASYQQMLAQASDAIMGVDAVGRVTYWNAAAEHLYEVPETEAIGQAWWSLVTVLDANDDRDGRSVDALASAIATGTAVDVALRVRTRSGRIREVACRWSPLTIDAVMAGDVVALGIHTDETARNAERAEHARIEADLSRTLDEIQDALFFFDREWRFTFANEMGERYIQNPRSRLLGAVLWDLYPETYDASFGVIYRRAMDERVVATTRDYYPALASWFEATAYPIDEGIAVILRDVTEDQRRREELDRTRREALEQAALLEAARDAMIVLDRDGAVRVWNTGAALLYDRGRDEARGIALQVLLSAGDAIDGALAAVVEHGHWQGELRHRTPSGRVVVADCRWQTLVDDSGEVTGIFAVHSDVTELRARQEASIRDQRIESLGTLAGGMAHDLNNVLTPLLMSVQLLRARSPEGDVDTLLETMELGIRRGADMIRQVLTFARGSDTVHEVIWLRSVMDDVERIGLAALPKSIDVVVDVGDELAVVGDATQIGQVLVNLITNARDAMPAGGLLAIRAFAVDLAEDPAHPAFLNPGPYVRISVEDTGHGMDAVTLDKIFEPFYTTKPLGEGTGLGLSTSRAIVRSHGGRLAAYSEPGRGTRFDLYLPTVSADAPVSEPGAGAVQYPVGGGQLILVVDDESAVRHLVCQTLDSFGYRTLGAQNGRDAIEVLSASDETVHLVFTDMMMPVMDGAALAAYLLEHHPGIPIVAASGLNANGGVARASGVGVHHFIAKPFSTDTLLRTVADALSRGRTLPGSAS